MELSLILLSRLFLIPSWKGSEYDTSVEKDMVVDGLSLKSMWKMNAFLPQYLFNPKWRNFSWQDKVMLIVVEPLKILCAHTWKLLHKQAVGHEGDMVPSHFSASQHFSEPWLFNNNSGRGLTFKAWSSASGLVTARGRMLKLGRSFVWLSMALRPVSLNFVLDLSQDTCGCSVISLGCKKGYG